MERRDREAAAPAPGAIPADLLAGHQLCAAEPCAPGYPGMSCGTGGGHMDTPSPHLAPSTRHPGPGTPPPAPVPQPSPRCPAAQRRPVAPVGAVLPVRCCAGIYTLPCALRQPQIAKVRSAQVSISDTAALRAAAISAGVPGGPAAGLGGAVAERSRAALGWVRGDGIRRLGDDGDRGDGRGAAARRRRRPRRRRRRRRGRG